MASNVPALPTEPTPLLCNIGTAQLHRQPDAGTASTGAKFLTSFFLYWLSLESNLFKFLALLLCFMI